MRIAVTRPRLLVAIGFGLLALRPAVALSQSQPAIDGRTWRPSVDPDANLVLEPTATPGAWQWNVGEWVSYEQAPYLLPAQHPLVGDVVAGIGLGKRAAVGMDLPWIVWQDGPASSGLGDAALFGKVTMISNAGSPPARGHGFGLAAVGAVTLPTGDRASFAGEASATFSARLLAEDDLGAGAVRASLGYVLRTKDVTWTDPNVTFGDEIPWSAGLVLRPKAFAPQLDPADFQRWEIAVHGALPAGPVAPFGFGRPGASLLSHALLAVDDRIALGHYRDAYILLGADFGVAQAVGVPAFRGVVAFGWAPRAHDKDADGVLDDADDCPRLAEDRDGIQDDDGCPEDDADGDDVLDIQDACPLVAGVRSPDPRKNGCPEASEAKDQAQMRGTREEKK